MQPTKPPHEAPPPRRRLALQMAERGAWRLITREGGRILGLDTVLGHLPVGDRGLREDALALLADAAAPAELAGAPLRRHGEDLSVESLPPVLAEGSRALVAAGTLSEAAFDVVHAALASGRNVVCAGPYAAAWPAMAAWLEAGRRPAVLAPAAAAGLRWQPLAAAADGAHVGADRIGCWGAAPKACARALSRLSGAIGHVDAHSLERALMRLERGFSVQPTVGVLSAVDLVACFSFDGEGKPVATGIFELVMTDNAYRPQPLFVRGGEAGERGHGPLLASGLPTFVDALRAHGRANLVDELAAAAGSALPAAPNAAAAARAAERLGGGELERRVAAHAANAPPDAHGPYSAQAAMMLAAPRAAARAGGRAAPGARPMRESAARPARGQPPLRAAPAQSLSPGWELEQGEDLSGPLPFPEDEPGTEGEAPHPGDLDAAALAATFGLAPPRAPRALGAEATASMAPRPTADGQAPSFLDALAKSSRPSGAGEDTFVSAGPASRGSTPDEPTVVGRPTPAHGPDAHDDDDEGGHA